VLQAEELLPVELWWLRPNQQLLCTSHLLRSSSDLLRSRADLLCTGSFLLCTWRRHLGSRSCSAGSRRRTGSEARCLVLRLRFKSKTGFLKA
jgi:hypothetical protein